MDFIKTAKGAVDRYSQKTTIPQSFTAEDAANFNRYLIYKYNIDIQGLKPNNLSSNERTAFEQTKPYAQYLNYTVYRAVLNKARLKYYAERHF